MRLLVIVFFLFQLLYSDINLIKRENSYSNKTLLVIGGIHGDKPGGYFAASLCVKRIPLQNYISKPIDNSEFKPK